METTLEQTTAITSPDRLKEITNSFINEQDVKANSKTAYKNNLTAFFVWIKDKGYELDQLSRPSIIEYKQDMLNEGKSILTISARLSTVRLFFEWCEGHRLFPNIARGVKAPKRREKIHRTPLTAQETSSLLDYFANQSTGTSHPEAFEPLSITEKRNFALVNLMFRTGMRCIEISRLNINDIFYSSGTRKIAIRGKGYDGVSRILKLSDKAYKPIQDYLSYRGATSGPVFVSTSNNSHNKRLNTRTISAICKKGMQAVGIDDRTFTAHSARHTFAVLAMKEGASERQVQFDLGHTTSTTTQIYTKHIHQEQMIENGAAAMLDNVF